jgi:hypothetical protein
MRAESNFFALLSSAWRLALIFFPARLMKKVNMRMPELGPLGETFLEARDRAIVVAFFVNRPSGGWVESVVTLADQRLPDLPWDFVEGFLREDPGMLHSSPQYPGSQFSVNTAGSEREL